MKPKPKELKLKTKSLQENIQQSLDPAINPAMQPDMRNNMGQLIHPKFSTDDFQPTEIQQLINKRYIHTDKPSKKQLKLARNARQAHEQFTDANEYVDSIRTSKAFWPNQIRDRIPLPIHVKQMLFDIASDNVDLDNNSFSAAQREQLGQAINNAYKRTGELTSNLTYEDYGPEYVNYFQKGEHPLAPMVGRSMFDPRFQIAATIGQGQYTIDPQTGTAQYKDMYDWNPGSKNLPLTGDKIKDTYRTIRNAMRVVPRSTDRQIYLQDLPVDEHIADTFNKQQGGGVRSMTVEEMRQMNIPESQIQQAVQMGAANDPNHEFGFVKAKAPIKKPTVLKPTLAKAPIKQNAYIDPYQKALDEGIDFSKNWLIERAKTGKANLIPSDANTATNIPKGIVLSQKELNDAYYNVGKKESPVPSGSNIAGFYDSKPNKIYAGSQGTFSYLKETGAHEAGHAIDQILADQTKKDNDQAIAQAAQADSVYNNSLAGKVKGFFYGPQHTTPSLRSNPTNYTYDQIKNELAHTKGRSKNKYLTTPTEVHARLMEIRQDAGFKPNQTITYDDYINYLMRKNTQGPTNKNIQAVNELHSILSPESISRLLNDVVYTPVDHQQTIPDYYNQPTDDQPVAYTQQGGKLIKRADGSYSQRGLWDNIRANKGSGRKPNKEMLKQERKINRNYQDGGDTDPGAVVEKGEVARDEQGNLIQVNKQAPSHDDGYMAGPAGMQSTPDGKGGVMLHGLESVLSDSQSQINQGERINNPKDAVIKIKPKQASELGKKLGLTIKPRQSLSPSKLFLALQQSRDNQARKYTISDKHKKMTGKPFEEAQKVNAIQQAMLPDDQALYDYVFANQEQAKQQEPNYEQLPDQHGYQPQLYNQAGGLTTPIQSIFGNLTKYLM